MRILLATDGSPCSNEAIREIGRRPWPPASEITVLTAFELSVPPITGVWALPPGYLDQIDQAMREQARVIVEKAVEKLKSELGEGVAVKGKSVPGPPGLVILDEAEKWDADLIVVGSHGYRAWQRFLLGSVSQSVVSNAKCSVEVVRCRGNGGAGRESTSKGG